MQKPLTLTDPSALLQRRTRGKIHYGGDPFWHREILLETQERLIEVNRSFTNRGIVSAFSEIWRDFTASVVDEGDILPLNVGAYDLIVHDLGLHWSNDPLGQLIQCRRALCADGLFLGFLFGGKTLHELRSCLAEAEVDLTGGLSPRVLPMAEVRDLGGLLQRADFTLPVADSFTKTVFYRDMWHLMRDLRHMGEGNALAGRLRHFTRRSLFSRAADLYRSRFGTQDGQISATFEVICLTGWAPHESQQKPLLPGSATQSLESALSRFARP